MNKALWISGGVSLAALIAMFNAPAGRADPLGTALRTIVVTVILAFLGRLVGSAAHRRPPRPSPGLVVADDINQRAITVQDHTGA